MSRSAQNDGGYAAQTNPTPEPTLTLNLNLTLTLAPTPNLWGALGLLSRSAGAVLSLRAILKTLHVQFSTAVRAIKRLVELARGTIVRANHTTATCVANKKHRRRDHVQPANEYSCEMTNGQLNFR